MAFVGNIGTPGSGYWYDDFGNSQFWCPFTMPTGGGTVTDFYLYAAGDGGTVTVKVAMWDAHTLLWNSGNVTLPSGSRRIHGQSWVHVSVPSVSVAAGTLNLGFWTSGGVVWTFEGSGATYYDRGIGGPVTLPSSPSAEGGNALGVYIGYTPGGGGGGGTGPHIRRSGAWGAAAVGNVHRAGAWSALAAADLRRSGAWGNTS